MGRYATLDLLLYLARRLKGYPLLILVTWRDQEGRSDLRLRKLVDETSGWGWASS